MSEPQIGQWRHHRFPLLVEIRPPRLWRHTRGMRGMPGSWEKSSSFNGFLGATDVTKRQTKEVSESLHIYIPPFVFWPGMSYSLTGAIYLH